MRKTIVVTFLVFVIYISTGLEKLIIGRNDIENMLYITTVGVDKTDNGVKLSIIAKKMPKPDDPSAAEEKNKYYVSEGETIFDANRNFDSFVNKDVFWGHVDNILISEELAQKDVDSTLDYFIRDHESKLTSFVYIVKGSTAEEVIKMVTDQGEDITGTINTLRADIGALSVSGEMDLLGAFNKINNKYCSCFIPTIMIEEDIKKPESDGEGEEKESKNKRLVMEGFAFYDQDTADFVVCVEGKEARGFNFIINEIKSGSIVVKDPEGELVNLEIIDSKTEITPEFDGDEIKVKIKNTFSTNIVEITGTTDLFKDEHIQSLIKQQNKIVKDEIQSIIDLAIEHKADLFDLSNVIKHKKPLKWNKIKDDWKEVMPEINFEIIVESKINRTYTIKKPARSREDEES